MVKILRAASFDKELDPPKTNKGATIKAPYYSEISAWGGKIIRFRPIEDVADF